MNHLIGGITVSIAIVVCTFFVCKNIENKNLNKRIKVLSGLLLLWIVIRTIKYVFLKNENATRIFWYLYYFFQYCFQQPCF